MVMRGPANVDELLDLVDQAIFEMEDVLMCAGDEDYEDFEFSELTPVYEYLVKALKQLHADLTRGESGLGRGQDLEFMPLVEKWSRRIPFAGLLGQINSVYKSGFGE